MKNALTSILLFLGLCAPLPAAEEPFQAALARAQLALDTGRIEEARGLFEELAAEYPRRASDMAVDYGWVYIRLGYKAFIDHQYKAADEYFSKAASIHLPHKAAVTGAWGCSRMEVAGEMLDAAYGDPKTADWKKVEACMVGLIDIDPNDAWAHCNLGRMYRYLGRKDAALREYKAALGKGKQGAAKTVEALEPAALKAAQDYRYHWNTPRHPLLSVVAKGPVQRCEEKPFVIHHRNQELARRTAAALRYYLSREVLGGVLEARSELSRECVVYIYGDTAELYKETDFLIKNAGGLASAAEEHEGDRTPAVHASQADPAFFDGLLPHELAHVRCFMHHRFTRAHPAWLDEGIAMSAQANVSPARIAQDLDQALKEGKLSPAEQLLVQLDVTNVNRTHTLYAQSYVLVNVLIAKFGKENMLQFIEELKGRWIPGTISPEVANDLMRKTQFETMKKIYGLEPSDVDKLILDWISANLPQEQNQARDN